MNLKIYFQSYRYNIFREIFEQILTLFFACVELLDHEYTYSRGI